MTIKNTRQPSTGWIPLSWVAVMALSVVLISSCGKKEGGGAPPASPPIESDVMVIHSEPFSFSTQASGTVLANEFVELKPEVNGRIVQLNINEGAMVSEGTLLAKLYDEDLQAQLRKYQSQLETAQKTEGRLKKLLDMNGLNQQEYDVAVNAVSSLQADIDFTKAQIRKTEVRAPFSGLIGLRNVSNGAYVTPTQVLATLQQVNALKMDFVLPEDQASAVKNGSVVKLVTGGKQELTARVIAIEPQVNEGTRNVRIRAMIEEKAGALNPGAFVTVQVENERSDSAILIPTNAIIPDSRNKKVALLKNGKVKFQIVQTGYRGEEKAEITSGLAPGDTLITSGLLFLKPDAPLKIRSVK